MKPVYAVLIAILPPLALPLLAAAPAAADEGAPVCYSYAIVGYDMVINAQLGVPPEQAVGLAAKPAQPDGEQQFSIPVLKLVLGAYAWRGGPDDYATQVMNRCAQQSPGRCFDSG